MKILKVIFLLFFSIETFAQNHTIYGYIKDKNNGESLIGATVSIQKLNTGAATNNYGFYSITTADGKYNLKYSYIGYETIIKEIELSKDTLINIELPPSTFQFDEIVVKTQKNNIVLNNEISSQSVKIATIKALPNSIGEADVIKSLQYLPGVQTANEGTTNLSVRGGSFDQNLFLLDNAPVYNPSHALGFFSVFNPDAIRDVKIYKAAFPAQYGGRLSSIVDLYMKEGNSKKFSCSGGIGLIASRLTIEAPLIKDKLSYIVSGRYSYTGFTINTLGSLGQDLGMQNLKNFNDRNEINFYDLNAKINYSINNKNRVYLSAYSGSDHFHYYSIDNRSSMDWGNFTSTIRWNHVFNSKLFSNTILAYSKYNYSYILKDDARHFKWKSNLQELDFKTDYDFFINTHNHLKYGLSIEGHKYYPGKIEPRDNSSIINSFELDRQKSIIGAIYLSNDQKVNNLLNLNYGIRYSTFFLLGANTVYDYSSNNTVTDSTHFANGELIQFYHAIEPRVAIRLLLNEKNSIKLSYTNAVQYQHLISNSSVGYPSDVWLPSNKYIKPQNAHQFVIGYYKSINENSYEFNTEIYYRKMNDIIDYRDNADLFLNKHLETQILSGKGQSYGIEFFLKKKTGKLKGWISYTLSKTTKQIEGVNNNNPYPAMYDKRHNLSTVINYNLSGTWSISSVFKFTSGGYITAPEGTFNFHGASFNYYTSRNGYKLPPYHRLDISFSYKSRKNKRRKWKTEWNFGVYNVYGRKNIFALFVKQDNLNLGESKAYKMYLYSVSPFVTFNFKF